MLRQHSDAELLLGFPAAPFILPLAANDHRGFLEYAEAKPDHTVRIKRRGMGAAAEWTLSPADAVGAYELAFKLPEHIEEWISGIGEKEQPAHRGGQGAVPVGDHALPHERHRRTCLPAAL